MKSIRISVFIGALFHAICLLLMILTSDDWKHEGLDTEISYFFLLGTIWPLSILPKFTPKVILTVHGMWAITPLFNALIVFSILFTFEQVRKKRAK